MKAPRKKKCAVLCSVMGMLVTSAAVAQNFPTKPVRIVCGFSAGSATDITSRMLAPKFSEYWVQPVVIENRPGAGSTLASVAVARATPDGHTIL